MIKQKQNDKSETVIFTLIFFIWIILRCDVNFFSSTFTLTTFYNVITQQIDLFKLYGSLLPVFSFTFNSCVIIIGRINQKISQSLFFIITIQLFSFQIAKLKKHKEETNDALPSSKRFNIEASPQSIVSWKIFLLSLGMFMIIFACTYFQNW